MMRLNKLISIVLLGTLSISTISNAFIPTWYRSYQISGLSLEQQQRGFLLEHVQQQANLIINIVTNHDPQAFRNLITQKKTSHLSLSYHSYNCFDLMFHHEKESAVAKEFDRLITASNELVIPITAASLPTISNAQVAKIKNSFQTLDTFISKHKVRSSTLINQLQQKAITENKPITSFFRSELLLPVTFIAGALCYYLIWKNYIYKTPQERKIEERTRRNALDVNKTLHNCSICCDDKKEEELELLLCKHKFCTDCLTAMIKLALKEKNTNTLRCPNLQCKQPLTKEDVAYITLYDNRLINQFAKIKDIERISADPNGKSCTTRDCSFMFINNYTRTIHCPECRESYCSNCLDKHQSGITINCVNSKTVADRESARWLLTTKPCPRCNSRIEKIEGCDRMVCKCRHEFCWQCSVDYYKYKGNHQVTCIHHPQHANFRHGQY